MLRICSGGEVINSLGLGTLAAIFMPLKDLGIKVGVERLYHLEYHCNLPEAVSQEIRECRQPITQIPLQREHIPSTSLANLFPAGYPHMCIYCSIPCRAAPWATGTNAFTLR